jgi:hypothetical protein
MLLKRSSPQSRLSGTGYPERNGAEALPAFAHTSYGAVASPFHRAETFGEGRSSLESRDSGTEYPGEGK